MDIPANNQLIALEEIILSWYPKIDIKDVINIKLEEGMISYIYEGGIHICENRMYGDSLNKATLARVIETKLAIEERALALR